MMRHGARVTIARSNWRWERRAAAIWALLWSGRRDGSTGQIAECISAKADALVIGAMSAIGLNDPAPHTAEGGT